MRFGSVCSGIEAASVAFSQFGWEAAWLSEVDVSASAVLAHRFGATAPVYPASGTEKSLKRIKWGSSVANWGDMNELPRLIASGEAEAPDLFCGGTPCQDFSVAGRRDGLNGVRGNLTLTFFDIADQIDAVRESRGEEPCVVFWENVPGVLSDGTNAFGCFLGGLAGDDVALEPGPRPEPGRSSSFWKWNKKTGEHSAKWPNAGFAVGPKRSIAWIVKDAQYFGLAQRRARVFVVASAREGFDPSEILFEFEGLRRDSAPSRESREEATHALAPRLTGSGRGVRSTGDIRGQDPVIACERRVERSSGLAYGFTTEQTPKFAEELALTLTKQSPSGGGQPQAVAVPIWWDGSDISQTLDAVLYKGQTMPEKNRFPAVLQPVSVALRGREGGGAIELGDDVAGALRASGGGGDKPHVLTPVYAIQERACSADTNSGPGGKGWRDDGCAYTLEDRGHSQAVAVVHGTQDPCDQENVLFISDVMPFDTTQITNPSNSSNPQWGNPCHTISAGAHPPAVCITGDVTHTLTSEGHDASEDGTGRGQPIVVTEMAVRRLMPIECERLQGFPDNWTLVPIGKGFAADGPRYKQIGNSWAVPCVTWIAGRIESHLAKPKKAVDPEVIWLLCA